MKDSALPFISSSEIALCRSNSLRYFHSFREAPPDIVKYLRAILQADGAEVTRREFPVNLAASGMTSLSWPVTTPSGKVLTAVVTAIVANDARADNNQAQATTSVAIALQRQLSPMILQVQPK